MSRFDINFEFNVHMEDAALRVWIDGALDSDLDSETEIPLTHDGRRYTATFDDKQLDASGCFWLRVAIVGKPGAWWDLEVREQGDGRQPIYHDSDVLTLPKEWLVATCHRQRVRLPAAV